MSKDFDQNKEEKVFRSVLKIKNETLGNDGNLEVELKTPGGDQYSDFEGQVLEFLEITERSQYAGEQAWSDLDSFFDV